MTEDKMVGWHQHKGHEFEQTLGDGEGQGSPVCCSPWSHKESNMTEQLNNNNKFLKLWKLTVITPFNIFEYSKISTLVDLSYFSTSAHWTSRYSTKYKQSQVY